MSEIALNGADFRARVRLSTKDNHTLAQVGETCVRVPAVSLPLLLASRKIEPIEAAWTDLGRPADAVLAQPDGDDGRTESAP